MPDETRRDHEDDDKLSGKSKQRESDEREAKKKTNLKDLDIRDEAGGALKGGVPKIPDAPFE